MTNKPYVLHVITRVDGGGSAVNTVLSVEGAIERGYPVKLVTGSATAEVAAQPYTLLLPELVRNVHPVKDLKALFKLAALIRREKPDILHVHCSKAGFIGRMAGFLARTKIIIYTPHGHVFWGYFGAAKTRFYLELEKLASLVTDKIVALTATERDEEIECGQAKPAKFVVIPSGVDLSEYTPRAAGKDPALCARFGVRPDQVVLGSMGRLVDIKGLDIGLSAFIKVAAEFPEIVLLIAGDGPEEAPLKKMAADAGLSDRVRFLGWLDAKPEFLSVCDLFVMPSRNEGMGRAAVEAMAAGLPVVASRVGGIKDLVIEGENGLLCEPENVEALTACLSELLHDLPRARAMGERGAGRAKIFSLQAMIDGLDELYGEVWNAGSH
jgi:glycosyltransferase involved in cell wall biosynthesis